MSWTHDGETFPVDVSVRVRFRMQVTVEIKPLTPDVPEEVAKRAAGRLQTALDGAKEQVEAAIFEELRKRAPGVEFGLDDKPPDGWHD